MKPWLAPFLGVSLMAAIGWSTNSVSPITNPRIRRVQTNLGDSSLVGQFQTSASGWLWDYTEVYLNNGIKLRKMSEHEKKEAGLNDGKNHGALIIPRAEADFRGIMGDVERHISAWSPTQSFRPNDPRQTLPLFRLMTWFDPYFVEGWTTGAMVVGLGRKVEANQRAREFLREGLRHNPDCVDIPTMFAMLCITREKDLGLAEKYLEIAIKNGKSRFEVLPQDELDALQNAYRWLALVYRDTGQPGKLHEIAQEGLRYFPEDMVLPSTSRPSVVPSKEFKPDASKVSKITVR
jgi:hypothetical protein